MVAIELLIIIGLILVLFLWAVWYRISTRKLRRLYKKLKEEGKIKELGEGYNDKIKKFGEIKSGENEQWRAEVERRKAEVAGREPEVTDADWSIPRPPQSATGKLFSATTPSAIGKNGSNVRTTGSRNGKTFQRRNPFRRR